MDDQETIASVEIEQLAPDPEIGPVFDQASAPSDETANPDAWLQWALVIGLLALFLICALLILVAWHGR